MKSRDRGRGYYALSNYVLAVYFILYFISNRSTHNIINIILIDELSIELATVSK